MILFLHSLPGIEMISFLAREMSERKFRTFLRAQFYIFVSHLNFILPCITIFVLVADNIDERGLFPRFKFPRFAPLLNDAQHIFVAPLVFR